MQSAGEWARQEAVFDYGAPNPMDIALGKGQVVWLLPSG